MNKKLHLMSELSLEEYCADSKWLKETAKGMSAKDVKENTNFVLESAQINQIPRDGNVTLDIDSEGIANIPVSGMLTNTVTPSAAFEGKSITTYNFITQSAQLADNDSRVKGARFIFATGGGEVNGVEQTSDAIFNMSKPTEALVIQAAESAGLWLASQTDKIISIGKTQSFGSLGVAAEFIDHTEEEEKAGRKRIILTSNDAPEKRFDIKTDEGQKIVIERMDEVHSVFVEHVVRGRKKSIPGITTDFVNKNFGRGGSLSAENALAVGMIDEIEGIPLNSNSSATTKTFTASQPQKGESETLNDEKKMTLAEFLAANPQAQVEHNALIAAAEQKGNNTLRAELKGYSAQVSPIISSESYTKRIKTAGIEVMSGERTLQGFTDMVAVFDENKELTNSENIQEKQPEPTPGDLQKNAADDTHLESPQITATIENLQKIVGVA